jgi:2-polyprenyl-3-methyl-5-hydroxy-6-metoxy-1,4-benzoquinol methylase
MSNRSIRDNHVTVSTVLKACPACDRPTQQTLLYRTNDCDIWYCESCGLGRTDAAEFDPTSYYDAGYFSGDRPDGYADYRASEPILRREFARAVEFIRDYRGRGRLLDIGCAYGFFLQEARKRFDVCGIELAADAAAHARRNGLNVMTGVADDATLDQLGMFDVITMFDVIEHLGDPRATLALVRRHLNPGGIVVMTTGDFGSPVARLLGARWRLMTPPQHLWFFTVESMRRLSVALGLRFVRHDHPAKIVPLSLMLFQASRMLGLRSAPKIAGGIGIPVNLFDAMRIVLRKAT